MPAGRTLFVAARALSRPVNNRRVAAQKHDIFNPELEVSGHVGGFFPKRTDRLSFGRDRAVRSYCDKSIRQKLIQPVCVMATIEIAPDIDFRRRQRGQIGGPISCGGRRLNDNNRKSRGQEQ